MTSRSLLASPSSAERIVARLGLISDTHFPDRLMTLPEAVFRAFQDVDLILHAGDVGELSILDTLSMLAPVVAVHGNDDSFDAQRELPYQQLICIHGVRLLLTHAHYQNRAEEMTSRRDDHWASKLNRRAAMGRRAAAQVVIFGHTHIPMVLPWAEVVLINPGAIAPGNHFIRQKLRSVARLLISDQGHIAVEHLDLDKDGQPFTPVVDVHTGFADAMNELSEPIIADDLKVYLPALHNLLSSDVLKMHEDEAFRSVLRRLALPRWEGLQAPITYAEMLAALYEHLPDTFASRLEKELRLYIDKMAKRSSQE